MNRVYFKTFKKVKSLRKAKGYIRVQTRKFVLAHSSPKSKYLKGILKKRRSEVSKSVQR